MGRNGATLLVFASLCLMGPMAAGLVAEDTHFVRTTAAGWKRAGAAYVRVKAVGDYGAFVWAELSDTELARLRTLGIAHEVRPDAFTLRLGGQSFDPKMRAPRVPAGWEAVDHAGPDLHLVQFTGPARAEWIEELRQRGLEVVQYIPPHTYVVWGDRAARAELNRAAAVRWAGSFAPAYRVQTRWRNLPADRVRVKVLMYRGADTDAVVRAIADLGGTLERRRAITRMFESAGFELAGSALRSVAHIAGVYSVQPVPTDGGLRGEMSNQVNVNNVDGTNRAFAGYETWLVGVGFDGSGVVIANVDGGIQHDHPDLVNRMLGCSGTTCGGSASSSHGTHTAGIMAADGSSGATDSYGFLRGLGVAPGAELVEQVYEPYFEWTDGMLLLMTDSVNNGAVVSGNSWGPSGSPLGYDNDTMQVDEGVRDADPDTPGNQPLNYVLSFMNGYGGTSSQGTPDEAKNIFTIGSTKLQTSGGAQDLQINDLSSNTAHGPARDGRTIPHMVAPGCYVDSTITGSSHGTNCGTSMASPHVAGAVALFIQYYRNLPGFSVDPSPALVKAAFLPVARDLAGNQDADGGTLGHPFDSKQGWGRMDLEAVVDPSELVVYFDNPVVFDNTGEEWSVNVSPDDPSKPMKMMLVWTDAPGHGLGGSTPAWNNDLDLIVTSGADIYRGNRFGASGWSVTGGVADYRNNTEGVFIGPTSAGQYEIRVVAADVNSDAIPGVGDTTDQDFSLVCYNCSTGPSPPRAREQEVSTPAATAASIVLVADDDGQPAPPALEFTITSLPANGALVDQGSAQTIAAAPYTLVSGGSAVEYQPIAPHPGADSFAFKANDGGVAPDGGDSNIATVSITVGGPDWDPTAFGVTALTAISRAKSITLTATDPNGDPLSYFIKTLPAQGVLSDGGMTIDAVPFELSGDTVRYQPPCGDVLVETFEFFARDATASSNDAAVEVTVTVADPRLVYEFALDADPGWATEGLWAFGTPAGGGTHNGDPSAGATGTNVYGYNLSGNYTNNMPAWYLTTGPLGCSGLSGTELRFSRWLGVERFDQAAVEVSTNGIVWHELWSNPGQSNLEDTEWTPVSYDISTYVDGAATAYVRWKMGASDYSNTRPGWNIDDVELWAVVPHLAADFTGDGVVNLDDFVTLQACLSGVGVEKSVECMCVDLDADGDVDLADFAEFQGAIGG